MPGCGGAFREVGVQRPWFDDRVSGNGASDKVGARDKVGASVSQIRVRCYRLETF